MKRLIKRVVSFVVAAAMACTVTIQALAYDYSGQSGGGDQSPSGSGYQFAIRYDNSNPKGIVGYRFTLIDEEDGAAITVSLDVLFENEPFYYSNSQNAYRFAIKHDKTWWIRNESSSFSLVQSNENIKTATGAGCPNLPMDPGTSDLNNMDGWVKDYQDEVDNILYNMGFHENLANHSGYKLLCEPIFLLKCLRGWTCARCGAENVNSNMCWQCYEVNNSYPNNGNYYSWCTMTITEIGIYGRFMFGENAGTTSSNNSGSWDYIANYTNASWPCDIYYSGAFLGYGGWSSGATNNSSVRKSFATLIRYGYGVSVISDYMEETPSATPITVRVGRADDPGDLSTAIEIYSTSEDRASGDRNKALPSNAILQEGETYYVRHWYYVSGDTNVPVSFSLSWSAGSPNAEIKKVAGDTYITRGAFFVDENAITISKELYEQSGVQYSYAQSSLCFESSISLADTEHFEDNDSSDNDIKLEKSYEITAPSITSWFGAGDEGHQAATLNGEDVIWYNSNVLHEVYSGLFVNHGASVGSRSSFDADYSYWFSIAQRNGEGLSLDCITTENFDDDISYNIEDPITIDLGEFSKSRSPISLSEEETSSPLNLWFIPKYTEVNSMATLTWTGNAKEKTNPSEAKTTSTVEYSVYSSNVVASITFHDAKTGDEIKSAKAGQEIYIRYEFKNETAIPVVAKVRYYHDQYSETAYGIEVGDQNWDSHYIYGSPFVIGGNGDYVVTNTFKVNGLNAKYVRATSAVDLDMGTAYSSLNGRGYEWNADDNEISCGLTDEELDLISNPEDLPPGIIRIESPLEAEPIEQNAPYTRNTDVISSFKLTNQSDIDIGTSAEALSGLYARVRFEVYSTSARTGTPIYTEEALFAVPAGRTTTVWFTWHVPNNVPDVLYGRLYVDSDNAFAPNSDPVIIDTIYTVRSKSDYRTPDTDYAERVPTWYSQTGEFDGASALKSSQTGPGEFTWNYWIMDGDHLTERIESAGLMGMQAEIAPSHSPSAEYNEDISQWTMRSGYGITLLLDKSNNLHCTSAQTASCMFPELMFSTATMTQTCNGHLADYYYEYGVGYSYGFQSIYDSYHQLKSLNGGTFATFVTLQETSNGFIFPDAEVQGATEDYNTTHFIPVWYPDGSYYVICVVSDYWTPGGMVSGCITSNKIRIEGSVYDDYVITTAPLTTCKHPASTNTNNTTNSKRNHLYTGDLCCEECGKKVKYGHLL